MTQLLRKGIGIRTQKEFAAKVGITPVYLNRLLNQEITSKPTRGTLTAMAKHMPSVTLNELFESCGYEVPDMQEIANEVVEEFKDFLLGYKREHPVICEKLPRFCEAFSMFCSQADCENLQINVGDEQDCVDPAHLGADKEVEISMRWNYLQYTCIALLKAYYAITISDHFVMIEVQNKKTQQGENVRIIPKDSDHSLLRCLFGTDEIPEQYITTDIGPGLSYEKTPDGFVQFLSNHRATFCTTVERITLWNRVVEKHEDPDLVFQSFADQIGTTGTGAAVAVILTEELKSLEYMKDRDFLYMKPCEAIPEEERDACIMAANAYNIPECPKELELRLYFYAKELGIEEFGVCYHRYAVYREYTHWHKTDDFAERLV